MITKQKAIEILEAEAPYAGSAKRASCEALVQALADAQAFPDEATLAEIESVAREVLHGELRGLLDPVTWRSWALRLASACRKLGMVKP